MANKESIAFFAFSGLSSKIPDGTFLETPNIAAININNNPTAAYKTITLFKLNAAMSSSLIADAFPNKLNATINGPIEVPNSITT